MDKSQDAFIDFIFDDGENNDNTDFNNPLNNALKLGEMTQLEKERYHEYIPLLIRDREINWIKPVETMWGLWCTINTRDVETNQWKPEWGIKTKQYKQIDGKWTYGGESPGYQEDIYKKSISM
jgi:hypothetical protein